MTSNNRLVFVVSEEKQSKRLPPILMQSEVEIEPQTKSRISCEPSNNDQFTRYRIASFLIVQNRFSRRFLTRIIRTFWDQMGCSDQWSPDCQWSRNSADSVWTLTDCIWHDVHKKILIMKKIQEREDRRCRPTELTWKNIGGQFLNFKFVWGELNATFYQFFDVTNVLLIWKLGNTVFLF